MNRSMLLIAAVCGIVPCLAAPKTDAFSEALLPKGNRIVYDNALKAVYEADMAADAGWMASSAQGKLAAHQAKVRAALVKSLGGFPERTPLNVVETGRVARDGYSVVKLMFESEPGHHVTANLFLPDPAVFPGKRPGILVPCGHSLNGKASKGYQRGSLQAAKAGMVSLVYDPIDQGERRQNRNSEKLWGVHAHNNAGYRAELLGWNTARFRIWDGMRALDVLAERPEVDATRLGVMGHSGGGTMSSWIMALDDRIMCAAPSGFLSTMRAVCEQCGPQDAEQYAFGELAFGFNHLGHVLLRAPSPVLLCSSYGDFFPFLGVLDTASRARTVYSRCGKADAFELSDTLGPHHWHESTRTRAVAWMARWLQNDPAIKTMQTYRNLQYGFAYDNVDVALGYEPRNLADMRSARHECDVTPTGCTLDLQGERTVYDIMHDEAVRQRKARPALSPEGVRAIAGIRPASEISYTECAASESDGISRKVLVAEDGTPVPLVSTGSGEPVLLVSASGRNELVKRVAELVDGGARVTVADMRGFGETAQVRQLFYGKKGGDEQISRLYALVGVNLVGKMAEDILAAALCASHAAGGAKVRLVACGRAAIAASHAYFTGREHFSALEIFDAPQPWSALFEDDALDWRFSDVVYGAWKLYDWTDLAGVALNMDKE